MVTAYVPIDGHPRSGMEYYILAARLHGALGDFKPRMFLDDKIPNLWMTPFIEKLADGGHHIKHSEGDNPLKNTMEYHAVQHNKFEWLTRAAMQDLDADAFVWLDIGCMRQPGFTSDLLRDFLGRIRKHDLAMPGCWQQGAVIDHYPCWRFCGTMFVVPRSDVFELNRVFKAVTRLRVLSTRSVSWEVNDLAHMELAKIGPHIRWYPADHNATMLTGY